MILAILNTKGDRSAHARDHGQRRNRANRDGDDGLSALTRGAAAMCLRRVGDLLARERAAERWLREQVGPAYDALKADPSRAVSTDKVRARIAVEHKALAGTKK